MHEGDPITAWTACPNVFGNDTLAVSDMSLTICEGDFITFLGPSGCGKSTALKMIAGLLPVTSGTISIAGPSGSEHDLGFVFQEPTLLPWATVQDNVFLPLRLAGRQGRAQGRVQRPLRAVGLSRFAGPIPGNFRRDENAVSIARPW